MTLVEGLGLGAPAVAGFFAPVGFFEEDLFSSDFIENSKTGGTGFAPGRDYVETKNTAQTKIVHRAQSFL